MEEAIPTIPFPPLQGFFTASELAAAEQLVQLSESSGDSAPRRTLSSSSFASSSSPRSVNTRPPAMAMVAEDEEEEEEKHEFGGATRRRRWPRYRLIADLYAATASIDDETSSAEKRIDGEERRSRQKRSRGGK